MCSNLRFDRGLGGFEMDLRLRDHLARLFNEQKKSKKDVRENHRAMAKLLKEAQRLKTVLSANVDFMAQVSPETGTSSTHSVLPVAYVIVMVYVVAKVTVINCNTWKRFARISKSEIYTALLNSQKSCTFLLYLFSFFKLPRWKVWWMTLTSKLRWPGVSLKNCVPICLKECLGQCRMPWLLQRWNWSVCSTWQDVGGFGSKHGIQQQN